MAVPLSSRVLKNSKFVLLLALLSAGSMWFYVEHVLIPYERADAAAHDRPRGNLSDLYPRWLGARELLLHHRDPYSPQITREIQEGYYGRALDPGRPNDPKDHQAFAYPVYVVFLLAPTVFFPFAVVSTCFRWLLVALSAATIPLWLRVLGWRVSAVTAATLLLFTLGSFPTLQGFKLQQLSLAVCGLIAGCTALLTGGYLLTAGILLALATIKPQLALPFAGWLVLWALAKWRERRNFLVGFGGTMAALLVGSEILLPGWLSRFRDAVHAYRQYAGSAGSALDVLVGPLIKTSGVKVLAVVIVLGTVAVCWLARRQTAGSAGFNVASAMVLATTVVIIPTFAPYNQLLLLPGIFLLIQNRGELWHVSVMTRLFFSLCFIIVFWPWIAAAFLAAASAVLPAERVQQLWPLPLYTSLEIPLSVLALLAIFAHRIYAHRVYADRI